MSTCSANWINAPIVRCLFTEMNRLVYNDEKVKALLAKKNGEEAAETLAEFNVLKVDDTPVVDSEDMGNEPRRLTAAEVSEQICQTSESVPGRMR